MSEAALAETETSALNAEELRDAVKRLLQEGVDRRTPYGEAGVSKSEALYAALTEQGWTMLTLAPELGGLGQGFDALAPLYEEMGRALSPVLLAPSLAAMDGLAASGGLSAVQAFAAEIAGGTARVAVATASLEELKIAGDRVSGGLQGVLLDPGASHLLIVSQDAPDTLRLVALGGEGVSLSDVEMWDRSRNAVDVVLDQAAVVWKGGDQAAAERVGGHLDLALAWDSLGGAQQIMDVTIGYLGVRQQFGRPIGSFQALKHRAADHRVRLEMAAALVRHATAAFARGEGVAVGGAGQARLIANRAYRAISEDAIQLHGGIGFTWEHDCHLFLKRAWLNEMLFEAPEQLCDRLAPGLFARLRADRPG